MKQLKNIAIDISELLRKNYGMKMNENRRLPYGAWFVFQNKNGDRMDMTITILQPIIKEVTQK